MKKWDVIAGLDVCVDLIVSGNTVPKFHQIEQFVDDYTIEMGGSAGIFLSQCAKLGLSALGVGYRGDDAFGALVESELRGAGVDVSGMSVRRGEKTGLGLCLVNGDDRGILTYNGTIDSLTARDFPDELLTRGRHFHISSFFLMKQLQPHFLSIIKRAKALGLTVSLDTNWDPDDRWLGVDELLPMVDVFMPNEAEADAMGGAEALAGKVKHLVVKRGENGASAYVNGRETCSAAAFEMPYADAIGAGDSFDAGFVFAWLSGRSMEECLQYGCACGSMNVRAHGGIKGQGSLIEVDALTRGRSNKDA